MTKPGRVHCQVIGCKRTAPVGADDEIICGKCWRTIPLYMRRRYDAMRKRIEKMMAEVDVWSVDVFDPRVLKVQRLAPLITAYWDKLKAAANDAKVGIR